ncbi:MAG: hypothetical protein P1U77_24335 [Rubripirellula sp.]|nr:hypothetical protein [Rubripirellula sp.]
MFAHSRGYWCKKFKGKQYNFGPWDDPQGALKAWREFEAKHVLGMASTVAKDGSITLRQMVNEFLDGKQRKCNRGDLSPRTLKQYADSAKWFVPAMGPERLVETIGPADFTRVRHDFPARWGISYSDALVMHVRTMLKFAYDNDLIDKPVRYGSDWSKAPKKRARLERHSKHSKESTKAETLALIDTAPLQIKAMILLGLKCGYGNLDCSRLRTTDLNGVWLDLPRGKTGEPRRAWLWKETRDAIKAVLKDHDGE